MNESHNTAQRFCSSCGIPSGAGISFCRQCGASLKPLYDDEATSVLTRPVEVSFLNQLNEKPDPEKLWWEGFDISETARILEVEGHHEESKELVERAMSLWTQALEHGVQGKSEVACHWYLGIALYDKAIDLEEHYRLSKEPLTQIPTLSKAVTELETAIRLDAQIGNFVFGNKGNQADLLNLDTVWGFQANYVKDKYGIQPAISYVVEKIHLIEHLSVVLPHLLYSFGMCYAEANDVNSAITLLRAAINAEDYGDVLDHEDSRYRIAQIAKKNAANKLKYIEVHGKAP
jgi:tetratricopeptide (TPR) repeat protein